MGRRAYGFLLLSGALAALVPACKKDEPRERTGDTVAALAEDGADTSDVEKDSENLVASLQPDPGTSAEFGEPATRIYLPRTCVTYSHDAPSRTVTIVFDRCTGPRGLLGVSGEVKATYEVLPNALTLDIVATNLSVNGASVDWSVHASITTSGLVRTMTWKGQLSGTTRRGRPFTRTNEKRVSWTVGQPCIAFEGTSEGEVSGRNLRTEVSGLNICRGACPDAGGVIAVTNVDEGMRIEIRFDGTQTATFVDPNGNETRFRLGCRA